MSPRVLADSPHACTRPWRERAAAQLTFGSRVPTCAIQG